MVTLRPWRDPTDLPVVRAAAGDPGVVVGTTVPAHCTARAGRDWIGRQHARRLAGTGLVLAVTDAAGTPDGSVDWAGGAGPPAVGMVGLTAVDPDLASCELGYWVVPAARGRGLSGRAAGLLVAWAFRALPLVRIGARVATDNVPSQRVAERAGLRREGVLHASFRVGDAWLDMVVYAAVRPDAPRTTWAGLQSSVEPSGSSRSDTELMQ